MRCLPLILLLGWPTLAPLLAADAIDAMIARGDYAKAESALRERIIDPAAPITSSPARRLEVLRRTRLDFPLTAEEALAKLNEKLPGLTRAEFQAWTAAGDLQHRVIDGEVRYFKKAISNVFLLSSEARRRRDASEAGGAGSSGDGFDTTAHVRRLVAESVEADGPRFHPLRHRFSYEVKIKPGNPRLRPGARVEAWLPFPQASGQQSHVRLIESEPAPTRVAPNGSPHRSLYFETRVGPDGTPPHFRAVFTFETRAVFHDLNPERVEPYRSNDPLVNRYTAERPPHIVFTPEVERLTQQIVGEETNPLEKARRVFRWVSTNIPWCGEMEYAIIPSLVEKGLAARRGDCGVQGMLFITLCRSAGVPARWQSGWTLRPGGVGLHDWAEFYVEPWGWLPADASYGVRRDPDPRVGDFFCGGTDPYRMIVNLDYARPFDPPKTSFRSEPNDFQRGEIEVDDHNLYFDEWTYRCRVETTPVE